MKSDNNLDKILSSNINNLNNLGNSNSQEDILGKLNNPPQEVGRHTSYNTKDLETIKENNLESEAEEIMVRKSLKQKPRNMGFSDPNKGKIN